MSAVHHLPVKITSPAPRDTWEALLLGDPGAMIYQTPLWTDALVSTGQYSDVSRLYEAPNGMKWILPLARKKTSISRLADQGGMPHGWGHGGLLTNQPLGCEEINAVITDLVSQPVMRTVIHPNPLRAATWEACGLPKVHRIPRYDHIIDLEGGFERVWEERFHSTTRTKVRKAQHASLTVEWDSTERLIPVFYGMYMEWTDRRARERHIPGWFSRWSARQRDPVERFQAVARVMKDAFRVYVARVEGVPVAATLFLCYKENAYYWRGTSLREQATPVRANDLLQATMIEHACQAGCRYFHMGESGGVASLERFKEGFGAVKTTYLSYSIEHLPLTEANSLADNLMRQAESLLLRLRPSRS